MQDNRNDGAELSPRRANPSPPLSGQVHALGVSDALRVDVEPLQLPWLADEIETLRAVVEEELARARARHDQLTADDLTRRSPEAGEAEDEVDRRSYQLAVLAMIREQLPVTSDVVAACVASPWARPDGERHWELARITAPVTVVAPAQAMLVLLGGATRNVADALAEALRGPDREEQDEHPSRLRAGSGWVRITGPVAIRLRDLAAAAEAFTDTYVDAVLQQSYSFDPESDPIHPDELW